MGSHMSIQARESMDSREIVRRASLAMTRTVVIVVVYVAVSALVKFAVEDLLLKTLGVDITGYQVYIQILLALAFGYLIVNSIAWFFYWSTRSRYGHPTAAAIRNMIRIIGMGALLSAIAGGVAGGAAGVALGGFLGIVIGFASQQVLGQAVAGFFLLIARPFRVGDNVIIAGEEGVVEDIATMFTIVRKADGVTVLIPNSSIIGGKIYLKPGKQ